MRDRVAPPNSQLRAVNPHVVEAFDGISCTLPTQLSAAPACYAQASGLCAGGVSSFGYSGTIVHALLQDDGVARGAGRPAVASSPHYVRRSFAWSEQAHPLAQGVDAAAPSGLVRYASPAAGALRSLVADHIVQGRVVFPGAGYLEMARAASDAASDAATDAATDAASSLLRRVFFLQPLLLDGDVAQLRVVCELNAAEERFEVRSELTEEGASTAHCGGSTGAVRGSCGAAVSAADLYSAFRGMGLEYGPAYRTLAGMWASPASGAAVGQLRRRRRLQGTSVHPADLDGALQLTALLATGAASEVRLPFSVESAALRGARGHLCPVAERQSASTTRVALVSQSRRGGGGAHLSGFETRALKAGAAARPAAPKRHLYVTAWTARALSADAGPEAAAASSQVLSGAVSSVASGAGATRATAAAAGGPRSVAFAAGVGGARAERDSLRRDGGRL